MSLKYEKGQGSKSNEFLHFDSSFLFSYGEVLLLSIEFWMIKGDSYRSWSLFLFINIILFINHQWFYSVRIFWQLFVHSTLCWRNSCSATHLALVPLCSLQNSSVLCICSFIHSSSICWVFTIHCFGFWKYST